MRDEDKTIEQLRDELADMRQRAAELDTLDLRQEKAETMLRRLANISDRTGIDYFRSITAFITEELDTQYALIGKLNPAQNKMSTIAAYGHGEVIDDFEYDLRGTPCENVVGKEASVYPEKVQELFPEDTLLVDMKAESYAGIPIFRSGGQPLGIIVTVGCNTMNAAVKERCISLLQIFAERLSSELERKEDEDNLRKIKSSLSKAQHIAKIGNWDWNIETNDLWWSDEIYRIFGLAQPEFDVTYEAFIHAVHPDDKEFVKKSVDRALYEKIPYSIDHRIVLPDGMEKIVNEQAEVTFNEEGKPVRMLGTVQDVTELKHMEMKLQKATHELEAEVEARTVELKSTVELLQNEIKERKEVESSLHISKQFLESILDNTHMLVAYLDRDFNFIRVNKSYADADNKPVPFFSGKNHFALYPNKENEMIFNNVVTTGEPYFTYEKVFEYSANPERGVSYWDWSLMPVKTSHNKVEGLVLTLVDVTKRKKAEEKIKTALKEKEVLMREIHHRVKNNMTVITSLLQLQSANIEEEKYKQIFKNSINRIKSMALIHEKLYKSHDMAKVDFNTYLKEMINSMFISYGVTTSKVALKTEIEGITLEINTAIPCGLIINELVSNSLKYAFPEDRAGEIKVAIRKNDKSENELMVSDNGVGISEDLDVRNTDSLGLNLVNALVEQLQGNIELSREEGTEFVITFK